VSTGYNLFMSLLWFRRSRRTEAKQQPEAAHVEAQEPSPQPRAPLRIRNLLLLNLEPSAGRERIESAPPLGSRASVVNTVEGVVPGIQFSDGRGELATGDHRVTIDLGREDPVAAAVATAEGDSGIEMLRALLQQSRWRAYAPRAGVFIEADALDLFALPDVFPTEDPRWNT
jgi:hypothetical protein